MDPNHAIALSILYKLSLILMSIPGGLLFALGATRRQVRGMVLFDVVKIVTPGIGLGLLLTVALLRLNSENMGISLSEVENFAYVVGAAIAVLVAVLASLAPARRAASVPAMVAMRSL